MDALEVFDPTGATEVINLHAPRLDTLAGKTVAFLSDDMWQAHRMLPLIQTHFETNYPGIEVIPSAEFPMGNTAMDRDETADLLVERGSDAVVVGNAA